MIPVPAGVLAELAERFSYDVAALVPLGGGREDSDGVLYRIGHGKEDRVLKVLATRAGDEEKLSFIRARAAFFAYLGEHGVSVVAPLKDGQGDWVAFRDDGRARFVAYTYPFLSGSHPSPETWDTALIAAWGETIGQTHRLTQQYPIWQGLPMPDGTLSLNWRRELDSFEDMCEDAEVKAYWGRLRGELEALPQDRDRMGFVHNDPHMMNILVEGDSVKLLDFDVANCHFFASDLAIAIQSVLFTTAGGMDRPLQNPGALKWFTDAILAGYGREMPLYDGLRGEISLFLNYRRALLFTVMYGWLKTESKALESWKRMVLDPPHLL